MTLPTITSRDARGLSAIWCVLIASLAASAALAQPSPEIVAGVRSTSLRRSLESELQSSSFRVGKLRAAPIFELRNFGYDSNIYGTPQDAVSDVTAGISAGARGVLPLGRKHFLRTDSTAEYSWFAKEEDRRSWGWNAGGSLFGLYNRLTLEATGRTTERLEPVSAELDALFRRRTTLGRLGAELLVLPRLSVFGRLETDRFSHQGDELPVGLLNLDRTDTAALAGFSYRIGPRISMGLQTASYDSDFTSAPDREGYVHLATFRYEGNRLLVDTAAGRRNLDSRQTLAEGFDETTGSYFASLSSLRGSSAEVFGRRAVEYSIVEDALYYLDVRNGAAGNLRLGNRAMLRISGEAGKNEYPLAGGSPEQRIDDVVTLGGGIWIRVFRGSTLSVTVTRSEYDSNFPEFDRSVTRLITTFSLRGESF